MSEVQIQDIYRRLGTLSQEEVASLKASAVTIGMSQVAIAPYD